MTRARCEGAAEPISVSLLTGGSDKHYVFGLTSSLTAKRTHLDLIGSDELNCPEVRDRTGVTFYNFRGSQCSQAGIIAKARRITQYYFKLLSYAASAQPTIFHILWNNRFELLDRTILMLYYKLLGKKVVLTAHNVNAGRRDDADTLLNRITLRIQYALSDHIFVHTEKMKGELISDFHVNAKRVTVIPYGINNAVPTSPLTSQDAKAHLGLKPCDRVILFFGRITPYKGLDHLIAAFQRLPGHGTDYRLIVAGRPDKCDTYWAELRGRADHLVQRGQIILRAEFIPDEDLELYFKAADVLVLPYRDIYQSGVMFLGFSFGLPVIATEVGSLSDDIVEGCTGFLARSNRPDELADVIEAYFDSGLYKNLDERRHNVREYVQARHSWDVVAHLTRAVYAEL